LGNQRKGRLLVISAPSGTGKSTVCRIIASRDPQVALSISFTTRQPRGSEKNGVEYHFIDDATFDRMISEDKFLEWAEVHFRRYGSGREETEKLVSAGKDVFFDIDVQGGQQIKQVVPEAVLIFLLPPSIDELARRLSKRKTESKSEMQSRLQVAVWEMEQGRNYDHHVINDNLDRAVEEVERIRKGIRDKPAKNGKMLEDLIRQARSRFDSSILN
jgi:guanylate kinase